MPSVRKRVPSMSPSSIAVLDQALFSGTGFAAQIVLASTLAASELGAYALCIGVYAFALLVQTSVISDPALALLGALDLRARRAHLAALLRAQSSLWGGLCAVLAPALVPSGLASGVALPLAVLILCATTCLLLRRAAFAGESPERVLVAGAVLALFTAAGLGGLWLGRALDVEGALSVLALSHAAAALSFGLKPWQTPTGVSSPSLVRAYAPYARYGFFAALLQWVPFHVPMVVLSAASSGGFAATGQLRAALNLVMPALQLNGALAVAALARLVRAPPAAAPLELVRPVALAVAYAALVGVWGEPLLQRALRAPYALPAGLAWAIASLPLSTSASSFGRAWAVARARPALPFWASASGALVAVLGSSVIAGDGGAELSAWVIASAELTHALVLCLSAWALCGPGSGTLDARREG